MILESLHAMGHEKDAEDLSEKDSDEKIYIG
jgi:hypothetical protein